MPLLAYIANSLFHHFCILLEQLRHAILCTGKHSQRLESRLEDMGKPIGVADYQLIVPKERLQKVLADEIKAFSEGKKID